MTTQEKIEQLALAALRSAPPPASTPKPATYMAPFEKPKTVGLVESAKPAAESAAAAAPAPEQVAEAPAKAFQHASDPELRAEIEERDARIARTRRIQSIAASVTLLGALVAGGTWFATSPSARANAAAIIPALRQSVDDVKMIGSLTEKYDEKLEKIAVRGDQISDATRALGVDPDSLPEDVDPHMQAEMQQMMGGEGVTNVDRDRAFQQKFGVVGKLVGNRKAEDAKAAAPES
jgi:hypothetical protein